MKSLCFALLWSTCLLGCSRDLLPKQNPERPLNLILISVDTARADRYGPYGYEGARTPIVDRLAKEGTTFEYAIVPMPRTTPTLASIMTGLLPHEHGARDVSSRIRRGRRLASILKARGFSTAGVSGNPAAGKREGFSRGFDAFEELAFRDRASKVTDTALALASKTPDDAQLFLWAHYLDPHTPYRAPNAFRNASQEQCDALSDIERGRRRVNAGGHSEKALEECSGAYDAEVAYADSEVGRLLAGLRKAGRLDHAVVVFTSDHGENLGEWGAYYGHGTNVHDSAVRVPLVVAGAGVPKGARVTEPIGLHDLTPTMLSLMGVAPAERAKMSGKDYGGWLGRDVEKPDAGQLAYAQSAGALLINYDKAIISGRRRTGYCANGERFSLCWKGDSEPKLYDREKDPQRTVDVQAEHPEVFEELQEVRERWSPGNVREQSVSDGRFKLVERPQFEGGYRQTLYDLNADPLESTDVKDRFPEDRARLESALHAWGADIPGYAPDAINPETEAQLRALGYIE